MAGSPFPEWDMHRDHVLAAPGLRAETLRFMDRAAKAQWTAEQGPRWLEWAALPEAAAVKRIRAIRLRVATGSRVTEFPRALPRLTKLEYLSMPLSLAPKLDEAWVPRSVSALSFDETPGGIASIKSGAVFSAVRAVSAVSGELRFTRANFPRLERAALRFGPRSTMRAVLGAYDTLASLRVGPVHDMEELAPLDAVGFTELHIVAGRLASLRGLERFPALASLSLRSLAKLTDLRAIAKLPGLRSIEVGYCGALEELGPLLDAPKLQSVSIIVCNRIRLAEIADALVARRWEKLAITGKRHLYRDDRTWVRSTK